MVDTGSTGIVISRLHVGKDAQPTGDRFKLVYTSSGREYEGEYFKAVVDLYASRCRGGAHAQTVPMKVRAVERMRENKHSPWISAEHVTTFMMGVGFDRDTSSGQCDPGKHIIPANINPFLLLKDMVHGSMKHGFIIDLRGHAVTFGLTDANTAGFEFIHLSRQDPPPPHADEPGWAAPSVWLAVPTGGVKPLETDLLVDTGLGYSIVQAPPGIAPPQEGAVYMPSGNTASGRAQVAKGQRVTLTAKGVDHPFYDFVVGTPEQAPEYVSWRHDIRLHNGKPFINTSRHALNQFRYLYDDSKEQGRIGFHFFT